MRASPAVVRPGLALALVATLGSAAPARVDPEWLRLWEEAQRHRPAVLGSTARLAPTDEPGAPLVVHGQVFSPDGKTPAPGVVVFAYQTDRDGLYFSEDRPGSAWRLQGWARTDGEGRFELRTIRPGPYPDRSEPAHIHLTLQSPVHGRQWTRSLRFADDPLVTPEEKARSASEGRFGRVREVQLKDGVAHVEVFLKLKTAPDF
jgi:protocatechuate 3,4-dioxygenase beta subunit